MPQTIVLLGYKMQRGKDTVGKVLTDEFGFTRYAFADEIKKIVADIYDLSWEQLYTEKKNKLDSRYGTTPRQILQEFGREQRNRFKDIWCSKVNKEISKNKSKRIVITDLRHLNEYEYFFKLSKKENINLFTIRVSRPAFDLTDMVGKEDISEIELDSFNEWDYTLLNDKDIVSIQEKTRIFASSVLMC